MDNAAANSKEGTISGDNMPIYQCTISTADEVLILSADEVRSHASKDRSCSKYTRPLWEALSIRPVPGTTLLTIDSTVLRTVPERFRLDVCTNESHRRGGDGVNRSERGDYLKPCPPRQDFSFATTPAPCLWNTLQQSTLSPDLTRHHATVLPLSNWYGMLLLCFR